ncbi:MAG: LysR family transcriptional regulator [Acidiphilium sp.]
MSIRDLKTFLAIAETGSFAAAARAIYRTQSAVTAQMQALEERLGTALFDRTTRPPSLTAAGHAFVERAASVVAEYELLFAGENETLRGHLRLGVVPSVITGLAPRALAMLRARHPALHVEVSMGLSAELVNRVRRGTLDVALISDPLEPRLALRWSPFLREPMVLIAPIEAPTLGAQQLLATFPFIRYTRQAWVGQLIERLLRQKRLVVNETMMLDTLEAIIAMVHAGLGASIVPLRLVEPPGSLPVRHVTLPGAAIHRTLGLVELADHAKATLSGTLLGVLQTIVAQAGGMPPRRTNIQ